MNKIVIENNKIKCMENILVDGNNIKFLDSSSYEVEYIDCNNININFIVVDKNVKLYESSFSCDIKINNSYTVNQGKLIVNKFYNNDNVDEKIKIDLLHEEDEIQYNFCNICKGVERYIIDINHKAKKTISNVRNRTVSLKNSDVNFIINSNVPKECIKSLINQNTRIVTLDECEAKIQPNMYIDIDDVMAQHGSVIGTFKEDWLFYLMSKGISYKDALKLLIKGYLLIPDIVNYDKRKKIIDTIEMYWR